MPKANTSQDVLGTLKRLDRVTSLLLERITTGNKRRQEKSAVKLAATSKKPLRFSEIQPFATAICADYSDAKMSLRELSSKYRATLPTIRRVLTEGKCDIRSFGRIAGKDNPAYDVHTKLSDKDRTWLLAQDLKGVEHVEVADKLGISRERVRQICLENGHKPRREVMREQRAQIDQAEKTTKAIARARRRQKLLAVTPEVEKAANMWAAGKTTEEIGEALGRKLNTMGVWVKRARARWPDLFPRRYARHEA